MYFNLILHLKSKEDNLLAYLIEQRCKFLLYLKSKVLTSREESYSEPNENLSKFEKYSMPAKETTLENMLS